MANIRPNSNVHNQFPNYQGILTRLNRVNDDVRLTRYYKSVADFFQDQSMSGDEIITNWNRILIEKTDDEWFAYVIRNIDNYFNVLFWHQNPYFCNWIKSVYVAPEREDSQTVTKKSDTKSLPEVDFSKISGLSESQDELPVETVEENAESAPVEEGDANSSNDDTSELLEGDVIDRQYIENMSYWDLRGFADEHNIDISGMRKKDEILKVVLDEMDF